MGAVKLLEDKFRGYAVNIVDAALELGAGRIKRGGNRRLMQWWGDKVLAAAQKDIDCPPAGPTNTTESNMQRYR